MEIQANNVYVNKEGEFYKAAMSGNFYIVDCWPCDKNGFVEDIKENPYPKPVNTCDFNPVGDAETSDFYPNPKTVFQAWHR